MMFTAIMPDLQSSMHLSNEAVGLLIGSLMLGYAASSYPSSLLSNRIGEKWVICGGVALTAVSMMAFSFSKSFTGLVATGFMAGVGLGAYLPQGLTLLSREYPMSRVGYVIGMHETAAPAGQTLGPLFVSYTIATLGWPGCLQVWSLYAFAICVTVLLLVPSKRQAVEHNQGTVRRTHVSARLVFSVVALQAAIWSCNLGLLSMVPIYLAQTFLLDVPYVAFILGASRIVGAAGQLAGGYFSDRLGRIRILLAISVLVLVATLWITLTPFNAFYVGGLFFQAIVSSAFFPVFFAMVSDITDPSSRAKLMGLTNSIAGFIGGTVSPAVIGFLSDHFSYRVAFSYVIAMGLGGCVAAMYVYGKSKEISRSKALTQA
jgi:MFS family permease